MDRSLVETSPQDRRIVDLRVVTAVCCVLIGAVLGTAWALGLHYRFALIPGETPSSSGVITMSYADLAAILLTAVGVLVAVLGIGVAILAVWGFKYIQEQSTEAAVKRVEEELRDDGVIAKLVQDHLDKMKSGVEKILSAAQSGREAPATKKEEDEKWGNKNQEAGDE